MVTYKQDGEKGERIVIGELAKFDIGVAIPLGECHRFDLIIIYNNKLWKAQVKSSKKHRPKRANVVEFNIKQCGTYGVRKYSKKDCDVMILCDYETIFLLKPEDFVNKSSFSVRYKPPFKDSRKDYKFFEKYVISEQRIKEVFD